MFLVSAEVAEYFAAFLVGQCNGCCRCEIHHACVDKLKRRILQYFRIHGQMAEWTCLETGHDGIGNSTDTGLQGTQILCQATMFDFVLEKIYQVTRDLGCFPVRRQILGTDMPMLPTRSLGDMMPIGAAFGKWLAQ